MNFKSLVNKFKEPIDKNDLLYVVINGLLSAIIIGSLMGGIEGFLNLIRFPISFCMFLMGLFIGRRINKAYYSYHILYSVLGVLFCIIGYVFYTFVFNVFVLQNFSLVINTFFSSDIFRIMFYQINPLNGINAVINLLIFILMLLVCAKATKGNN